ncbi:zinc transporter [Clostridium novyi A str. 4552]|uniref:Zinc transporter n=1 Tax=Clostridium novyi A str. 4552 TaxID=1444289 RepID=A0A0A0I614_CLONO|nr:ZIP family metal transporter [Clostridium novyi]KGM96267.1 zinc transporter [Clostridium novyi A str. 4552]
MDIKLIFVVTVASIVSLLGTMIGASIGIIIKNPSKKVIGNINGLAAGLMLSVVMMDLIPESIEKVNVFYTVVFCILGICTIMLVDILTGSERKFFGNSSSKVAFMASIGLMIHNFPEGIIMGAGFLAYATLGIKMSIVIAIHDIPEGIAVAAPLMASKVKPFKIMLYAFITAFPTLLGSWLGLYIGNISKIVLAECLGVASGIMLYVVLGQMIPESFKKGEKIDVTVSSLCGVILGIVITNIL